MDLIWMLVKERCGFVLPLRREQDLLFTSLKERFGFYLLLETEGRTCSQYEMDLDLF